MRQRPEAMDFIERFFNVSPDGGSGALEIVYIALTTVALTAWSLRPTLMQPLKRLLQRLRREI